MSQIGKQEKDGLCTGMIPALSLRWLLDMSRGDDCCGQVNSQEEKRLQRLEKKSLDYS